MHFELLGKQPDKIFLVTDAEILITAYVLMHKSQEFLRTHAIIRLWIYLPESIYTFRTQ